jgi:hypothetical protein
MAKRNDEQNATYIALISNAANLGITLSSRATSNVYVLSFA